MLDKQLLNTTAAYVKMSIIRTINEQIPNTLYDYPFKVYLDDVREAPKGWIRVYTAWELKLVLSTFWDVISHVSFDNDLGENEPEGYTVMDWIEELVFENNPKTIPELSVHSANPVARVRMQTVINRINSFKK